MKRNALLSGMLLFISISARAYDANSQVDFSVTGTIEPITCNVAILPSDNVNIGTISSQHLAGIPGGNGPSTVISLQFSGCTSEVTSSTITFSGEPYDGTYAMIYKNNRSGSDAAGGIGLQLFTTSGNGAFTPLGNGDAYDFQFDDTETNTFRMLARLYTPYGNVSAGAFSTTVTFNVSYQ
ncbi:fimbrial protein [Enterobacter mori]|uniref:Fimbrial protein n=1 Tax=Enterobacter mori TaxID=539813 RepID=A0A7T0DXM6_9ENTR|nr:fimbrial protein [Enterobacter mori]QPK01324.1 fimbrial protein [Enterobacter mori]